MPKSIMDRVMSGVGDVDILGRPAAAASGGASPVSYSPEAEYTVGYEIDFGFESATFASGALIPVGGSQTLVITPVTPFKPKEMRIPSAIANDFEIVDILLADRHYIDGAPIPCDNYSEVSNVGLMDIGTINTTVPLKMTVRNIGAVPARFRGNFRGMKVTR